MRGAQPRDGEADAGGGARDERGGAGAEDGVGGHFVGGRVWSEGDKGGGMRGREGEGVLGIEWWGKKGGVIWVIVENAKWG